MPAVPYPPPAFRFAVAIAGAAVAGADVDASFCEVSGLEARLDTEDVAEGGQNRFVHRLPGRTRCGNLFLRRGLVTGRSALAGWLARTFEAGPARRLDLRTVLVRLLDGQARPIVQWEVVNAYPVGWDHAPLDAMGDRVMIETAEFAYQYFERLTFAYQENDDAA